MSKQKQLRMTSVQHVIKYDATKRLGLEIIKEHRVNKM